MSSKKDENALTIKRRILNGEPEDEAVENWFKDRDTGGNHKELLRRLTLIMYDREETVRKTAEAIARFLARYEQAEQEIA